MAIKLDIESYCGCCVEFEPVANRSIVYGPNDTPIMVAPTLIQCKHRSKCLNVYNYLRSIMKDK